MSTKELIEKEVTNLPESLQREVYEFARFVNRVKCEGHTCCCKSCCCKKELDIEKSQLELFELEYNTVKDLIIHYSTVRSALTSFLMTVGLGAFGVYFQTHQHGRNFLILVGIIMLLIAWRICLEFSWRTEKAHVFWKKLWQWRSGKEEKFPGQFAEFKPNCDEKNTIKSEMGKDSTNKMMGWLLVLIFFLLAGCLFVSAGWLRFDAQDLTISFFPANQGHIHDCSNILRKHPCQIPENIYISLPASNIGTNYSMVTNVWTPTTVINKTSNQNRSLNFSLFDFHKEVSSKQ